ncbi:MAG: 16S rRNA (guanine(527)-N(7))-methyltransferase RsmG [Neomegalonema sp.]|nr:16S rRNA (guanine(527)-N(7))-methyltransferase RsmG [Neomegalonema sp.]
MTFSGEQEGRARRLIQSELSVSRETMDRLQLFVELLAKWTQSINLVSRADRERIWSRHVLDSLGMHELIPVGESWIDVGSGGGFPAIPLALLAEERGIGAKLCMIEADQRKAAFLATATRSLGLHAEIQPKRIEDVAASGRRAALVTARALAPVGRILELIEPMVSENGTVALLKGKSVNGELTEAQKKWHMSSQVMQHPLSLEGSILLIQGFQRAQSS